MRFYPCFISFRHFGDRISEAFIKQFCECLSAELLPLTGQQPFIDSKRLQAGHSLKDEIADAICKSACMIVIWTPQYFNEEYLWCTMEYKAMKDLEEKRLEQLPFSEKSKRIIIPVIYRGSIFYPEKLKDIMYLNFENFTLYEAEMIQNKVYASEIKRLAEYITDRIKTFETKNIRYWRDCNNFSLPTETEAKDYVNKVSSNTQDFPFR